MPSGGYKNLLQTNNNRFLRHTKGSVNKVSFHGIKLGVDEMFRWCMEMILLQAVSLSFERRRPVNDNLYRRPKVLKFGRLDVGDIYLRIGGREGDDAMVDING